MKLLVIILGICIAFKGQGDGQGDGQGQKDETTKTPIPEDTSPCELPTPDASVPAEEGKTLPQLDTAFEATVEAKFQPASIRVMLCLGIPKFQARSRSVETFAKFVEDCESCCCHSCLCPPLFHRDSFSFVELGLYTLNSNPYFLLPSTGCSNENFLHSAWREAVANT